MPYYSYGYGYDSANLVYLILLVPVLLLSLYAQAAVSGNFSRYSKVTNPSFSPTPFTMPPRSRRSALPRMRRGTRCSTPWAMALSSCAAPL